MKLAGIDLAWHADSNPSGLAVGILREGMLQVTTLEPAAVGIEEILRRLDEEDVDGVAIDASLIIHNASGQRRCENEIGRVYGARGASCHASNTRLYPDAASVRISEALARRGYAHVGRDKRFQIECYPHPAIIEIFGLAKRLAYKKGRVADKRAGQQALARYLRALRESKVLRLELPPSILNLLDADHLAGLKGRAIKTSEDGMDALVCLYVAGLYAIGTPGSVFGDTETGYIYVPQVRCA
jgi:predicted RNase H-like nuclease